ncbi:lipoprotein lipase isoform X2 [Tachysurus fulvidraco]|uniref:lipoprotein lipase isoform X2 n=1 Tax=Tachysurus fulvidraco TaxID=1234273 RepID=UPI001FEE40A8|nr:lipoprotein lipase isoform X2 [Tachysurus fulvidraco]
MIRTFKCVFCVFCLAALEGPSYTFSLHASFTDNVLEPFRSLFLQREPSKAHSRFSLRKPTLPDEDICYIVPGKSDTLHNCNFNNTAKTFLVIHGWTVSGLFESWVAKLVAALYDREKGANVVVVDWLDIAQNHYGVAAHKTQEVGQEVGRFIDWIEETTNIPLEKIHLIGYSLGAHVAGIAGSSATKKVGRITGLDPAGPDFEGVHAHRRLSPDDAHFVDVLHTFSGGTLGLSIGIEQPVGHVDIYPNGGSFQPGCNVRGALKSLASYGLLAMNNVIKCEQERSVLLFIDSIINGAEASKAYSCGSSAMFERGVCLRCHKNRCNTVGYDTRSVHKPRSMKMFTKTRASMPFSVFHYQLKMHFTTQTTQSVTEFMVTVSLYGSNGNAENLHLNVKGEIGSSMTHSFLLVTEEDIGELLMLKLKMEDSSSLLNMMWPWWNGDFPELHVRKISIWIGEMQKKMIFCSKDHQNTNRQNSEVIFVKCKNTWRRSSVRYEYSSQ